MHGVFANGSTLDGFEGTSTNVQRDLFALNTTGIDILQYSFCKVQSGSRSRHTALDLGIDRLIGGLVALLGLAIEIGWNGQFTHRVENLGK